jgi:hypothetical protein
VHLGVGRIAELLGHVGVRDLLADLHRLLDGGGHPLGGVGEHEPRAEHAQHRAPLGAHRLGHGQDDVVPLHRRDERERDAGVATRGLDDRTDARLDQTIALGRLDHREADPIFHAICRIRALELRDDPRLDAGHDAIELHQGRAPDQLGRITGDLHGTLLRTSRPPRGRVGKGPRLPIYDGQHTPRSPGLLESSTAPNSSSINTVA